MSDYHDYLIESWNKKINESENKEMMLTYPTAPLERALFFYEARENPKSEQETTARLDKISLENKNENVKIKRDADGKLKLYSNDDSEIDDELRKLKILELAGIDAKIVFSQGFFNRMRMDLGTTIINPSTEEESKKQPIIKSTNNSEDIKELEKIEKTFGSLNHIVNGHSLKVAKNIEIGKDKDGNKYIIKDDVLIKYAESTQAMSTASESPKPTINLDNISVETSGLDALKKAFNDFAKIASSYGQGSYDTSDNDFEYGRSSANGALTFVTNLKLENSESKKYQFFFNGETISVVEKIENAQGRNIFRRIEDDNEKNSLIALATEKVKSKNVNPFRGDNVGSSNFVPAIATSLSTNNAQISSTER